MPRSSFALQTAGPLLDILQARQARAQDLQDEQRAFRQRLIEAGIAHGTITYDYQTGAIAPKDQPDANAQVQKFLEMMKGQGGDTGNLTIEPSMTTGPKGMTMGVRTTPKKIEKPPDQAMEDYRRMMMADIFQRNQPTHAGGFMNLQQLPAAPSPQMQAYMQRVMERSMGNGAGAPPGMPSVQGLPPQAGGVAPTMAQTLSQHAPRIQATIQQLRQQGMSDTEIAQHLREKGLDPSQFGVQAQ